VTSSVVSARGIVKRFAGVQALRGVDFAVDPGEVRGLLGKNGAGKSTLIKILSGVQPPDEGAIDVSGTPADFRTPSDALAVGIVTVYQELSVVPDLSVAENVMLGRHPRRFTGGPIDRKEMYRRAAKALAIFDRAIPLTASVGSLSIADQQLVEIARAMSQDAKLLILDEPTSSLAAHEVNILLDAVRAVAKTGVAVVYISHRLAEIKRVSDTVTVIRDGCVVGTVPSDAPSNRLVSMIFGDVAPPRREPRSALPRYDAPPLLEARGATLSSKLADVSLSLHQAEILGIAGLHGSGRTELLRALVGLDRMESGSLEIEGRPIRRVSVSRMLAAGLALAPEDRRRAGIVPLLGVDENLVMSHWERVSTAYSIRPSRVLQRARSLIEKMGIQTARANTPIETLSGGNQQKVVIGRWLDSKTKVLLLDEPTRGIDLHAKEQIFDLIRDLADNGIGVILVSSEFEELTAVCDRILVITNGTVCAPIEASSTTPERLLNLATKEVTPA